MFDRQIKTIETSAIILVIILACAVIGLGWIGFGIENLAVQILGAVWGPIALGAIFLVPLALFLLSHLLPHNRRKRRQQEIDRAFAATSMGNVTKTIELLRGKSPWLAAAAAVIVALVTNFAPPLMPAVAETLSTLEALFEHHKARSDLR